MVGESQWEVPRGVNGGINGRGTWLTGKATRLIKRHQWEWGDQEDRNGVSEQVNRTVEGSVGGGQIDDSMGYWEV